MEYVVVGACRETEEDMRLTIEAADEADARRRADDLELADLGVAVVDRPRLAGLIVRLGQGPVVG